MADDKRGREKQARDAEGRRRDRDLEAALTRGDEPEPSIEGVALTEVESGLESLEFPTTGAEVVATVGDREIESVDGSYPIEALLPELGSETFDSPAAVRVVIQRPSVAAAMKQVIEASDTLPNTELAWSQRKAYELTFQELGAIDAADDDEGIQAVSDWIVERIHDTETLPSSRDVRREAAKFCRRRGYQIRADEWLGV